MLSIDITDRQIKLVRGVHSGNKIRVQDADMRCLLYTSDAADE